MIVKLKILDNVTVGVEAGVTKIAPPLSFKYEYYKKSPSGGRYPKSFRKKAIFGEAGSRYFYVGLLKKVEEYLTKNNISYEVSGILEPFPWELEPYIPGITFRSDQNRLLNAILHGQRGVIESPMGSGKTILAFGLISAYPSARTLYLCPNISIVTQTHIELKEKGFKDISVAGDGSKDFSGKIAVSTIQTAVRQDLFEIGNKFDIVIIDEIHLASGIDGTLSKILSSISAPVRLGLTATLPKEPGKRLTIEGLIGPKLGSLGREEAMNAGILVRPKVRLVPVPYNKAVGRIKKYDKLYKEGIVRNRARNRLIAFEALKVIKDCGSVIIFVFELEHLRNVAGELERISLPFEIVEGNTDAEIREKIRIDTEAQKTKCVLSSVVWREGINIKSLGGVILGTGWKAEGQLLQSVGRSLRRIEGKDSAVIVDFLDPYQSLAEHAIQRIGVFVREGWI